MSHDSDISPNTPRTKTSGNVLFSAFKNLTGSRHRSQDNSSNPSSPSPATSPRDKPIEPIGLTLSPKASHTSDVSSAPSLANQVHEGSNDSRSRSTAFVGGPPELTSQLVLLEPGRPLHERVGAAMAIAKLLDAYPVDSTSAVWDLAKDMVSKDEEVGAPFAAYQLLEACVTNRKLSSSERLYFFSSVQEDTSDATFTSRLQVLKQLTNDGREVDCLEDEMLPLLVRMLKRAFDSARAVRKLDKSSRASSRPNAEKTVQQIFEFINDVIKFNSKTLMQPHAALLLTQVNSICNTTTAESDLALSLSVIDTVITYSSIPAPLIKEVVEVLSGIYCQIPSLKQQSWNAIRKLLNSHQAAETMVLLLDILRENPYRDDPKEHKYHSIRGAVLIFDRIYSEHADDEFAAKPSMKELIAALHRSLVLGSSKLEGNIMQLFLTIMKSDEANELLDSPEIWAEVVQIIVKCMQRPAPTKDLASEESNNAPTATAHFQELADSLLLLVTDQPFEQRHAIMELFLQVAPYISDATAQAVVEHHLDERLLLPSSESWLENWQRLFQSFFKDQTRSATIKMLTLNALLDAYNTADALDDKLANQLFLNILPSIGEEKDVMILSTLSRTAVDVATWTTSTEMFDAILNQLKTILHDSESETEAELSPTVAVGSFGMIETTPALKPPPDSFPVKVVKTTVRTFLRTINKSADKAEKLYNMLLDIAGSKNLAADARIGALKALFRLRSDINHGIFLVSTTGCDNLAASLCRTEQSATVSTTGNTIIKPTKRDETATQKGKRQSPSSSMTSLMSRGASVAKRGTTSRINKPNPPLWLYPGPKGLPEQPPAEASRLVFSKLEHDTTSSNSNKSKARVVLKIAKWMELVLSLLQQDGLDWEIYSYVVVHLGAQLTNHSLFADNEPQIKLLRSVLCQQLSNKTLMEPPSFTNLKKSDVAICLYDSLTMLISYSNLFGKNEQDELVKVLIMGIGSWERSSESCINALSICCHELPLSLSKTLESILTRLSQTITQSHSAVQVLEFLAGLARLPELYRNFREEEFRMVFGICFRYLQYSRDQKDKSMADRAIANRMPSKQTANNNRDASIEFEAPVNSKKRTLADDLPTYPYALIYHVMTFWFMSLRMEDRSQQISWIVKNLVSKDSHGLEVLEEQAQVTVDFMYRIAFSDRDDTIAEENFAKPSDGPVRAKNWLSGSSILTIETAGRTGLSQITTRRPSGTRYSTFRPRLIDHPRHQVPIYTGLAAETYYSDDYVGILPDDIMQEFYSPTNLSSRSALSEYPTSLPEDEATQRTIRAFDRISPLDGHKVGIIYVGEGQTSESAILSNVMGSDDYVSFLTRIGTLIELKNANFNTQGLDREFDTDGKFTFCWRDRVSEIVFHVTTMMPTNLEHDPNCTNKKKHIGNDFVNIIFNNSGQPYNMDTFPSDFNYVNIVITPEARASFIETRLRAARHSNANTNNTQPIANGNGDGNGLHNPLKDDDIDPLAPAASAVPDTSTDSMYYNVTVLTKPGIPAISPASETKVISGKSLPAFVRLLALNASVFSSTWLNRANESEHISSWRNRLREINRLRDKHAGDSGVVAMHSLGRELNVNSNTNSAPVTAANTPGLSEAPPQKENTRESAVFRRKSTTFFGLGATQSHPAENRLSTLSNDDTEHSSSTTSRDM